MPAISQLLPTFYQKGLILSLNSSEAFIGEAWREVPRGGSEKEKAYFLSPEYNLQKSTRSFVPQKLHRVATTTLLEALKAPEKPVLGDWQKSEEQYQKDFKILMDKISKKNLIKAVPFMTYKTPKPEGFNSQILPYIMNQLIVNGREQFLFGQWDEESGFLGSTPEILFSGTKEKLQLMALAGTVKASHPEDMRKDPKLWDEHQFVVKDITEKLSPQKVLWQETVEATYGALRHLKTEGSLVNFTGEYMDLIKSLSPTAALGVFPREEINNNKEPLHIEERGAYGAPFGIVDGEFAHFVVCIRGLFWDKDSLSIPVGGGIIAQSDYQTEFKELELKFQSTKAKLGL